MNVRRRCSVPRLLLLLLLLTSLEVSAQEGNDNPLLPASWSPDYGASLHGGIALHYVSLGLDARYRMVGLGIGYLHATSEVTCVDPPCYGYDDGLGGDLSLYFTLGSSLSLVTTGSYYPDRHPREPDFGGGIALSIFLGEQGDGRLVLTPGLHSQRGVEIGLGWMMGQQE